MSDSKDKLIETLKDILSGKDIAEGCMAIARLRLGFTDNNAIQENSAFDYFRGIDSELDDFVFGNARKYYAPKYLEELDKKLDNFLEEERDNIKETCKKLLDCLENLE